MPSSTRGRGALGCDFSKQGVSPGTAWIHLLSRAVAWTEPFSERNFVVVVEDLVGICLASKLKGIPLHPLPWSPAPAVLQHAFCCSWGTGYATMPTV